VVVTFENVPEWGSSNSNSFQIEMFFDGMIRITWLGVDLTDALAGLSEGYGVPPDFTESDLSEYGTCDPLQITPEEAFSSSGYEGGPFTPHSTSYTITNTGTSTQSWRAGITHSWIGVVPNQGTIEPNDSNTVEVFITAEANNLPWGEHEGAVGFRNLNTGVLQTRDVILEVEPYPAEIDVTDSILPVDDLNMPFGDVFITLSRTEKITITNVDPCDYLYVTEISLRGRPTSTVETADLLIKLPGVTGGPGSFNPSYLPTGWATSERPASKLLVRSGYRVLTDGVDVLLLASGSDPTILRTGLAAFPDIDTVDYFNCSSASPTEEDLAPYDAVVVMSNSGFYDATQTGNVLADYVDAGGKVVQAVASFAYGGGWELAGRFVTQEGYEPFVHGDAEFFPHNLGDFDAEHPIMDGVTTLTDSLTVGIPALEPEAEWVADWDNGTPLVATQGGNVVGINMFVFNEGDFTGDVPLLFHNAIVWLSKGAAEGFELVDVPELPAAIAPFDHFDVNVVFAPTEVKACAGVVAIVSNDEDEPEVEVLLSGAGVLDYLEVVPDELEFSGHPNGPFVPTYDSYQLTNNGPNNIDWTLEPNVLWLDISPSSGTLKAGESIPVTVIPNAYAETLPVGDYNETLTFTDITTTVEQYREVTLIVFTAPKIWIDPAEGGIHVNVPQGGTATEVLTIGNTGDADLNFNLYSCEKECQPPAAMTMAVEIDISEDKMVLEYVFSKPIVSKQDDYDWVKIEGLEQYLRVGAPIVPVRPAKILVPPGKTVVATQTVPLETYDLEGTYRLPPAQKPYPLSYKGVVEATKPDPAVYGKAVPWPGMYHEDVSAQSKRGYQLFIVNLFPLQYVPTTGEISYITKLRLEIELADASSSDVLRPLETLEAELAAGVDNPSVLGVYPETGTSLERLDGPSSLPSGGPYQYVIITNEALEAAPGPWNFQALRDAKTARGITATIVTTAWIYANYDGTRPDGGTDNQTRIRNFLIDAYQNWDTEYALLGGTNAIIPARMFYVWGDTMPVDNYYGCVEPEECTFDYDADGLYAEPTDGVGGGEVDLYAEIYVGRATVENATELGNFIYKTLTYDLTMNEYLPRIAMVGEYLGFGGVAEFAKDSMEQIRLGGDYDGYFTCGFENHGDPDFIDFNTVGCLPGEPTCFWPLYDKDHPAENWPKTDLINLMNGGIHVFNHLGHANFTYCMKLNTSDLTSLTNTDYFFAYSQGCMPGGFDTPNCFAEVITSMEYGAFAVVMNARYGYGQFNSTDGPSQRFDRQFWDAVLCEDMLEMGRANQDSKEDNLWDINNDVIRWCYYELNLFGDPEQRFRFRRGCDWLDLVPYTGVVAPGHCNDVNVVFNAEGLEVGDYCGEIVISSNADYTLTVPITMTVLPDVLTVIPEDAFEPTGAMGGPFIPESKSYTLTNDSNVPLDWTAGSSESWIDVEPNSGTLNPGGSNTVEVSINTNANGLDPGTYTGAVTFTNITTDVKHVRTVILTVTPPDYFTELFDLQDNDMASRTLNLVLDCSGSFYSPCCETAAEFPTDPNGGTPVLLDDDDYEQIILDANAAVSLYGQSYNSFYIGSNGYITFETGDTQYLETLDNHFLFKRISVLFDDLSPNAGGTVSWKRLADRVAVTFENVPEYSLSNANSFQVEMFFNGNIRITLLGIAAVDGLVGLSDGNGVPSDFTESDLSEYRLSCDLNPDCFPCTHPDYAEWVTVGKPECWCYPRQCHGDADGLPYGPEINYWVSIPDLGILKSAWNKPLASLVANEICADFDHLPYGKEDYRVSIPDLTILKANWNIPNGPDPNCLPGNREP